jgi:5-methylcytosine-specific restriction endonuclease McrA
MNQNLYQVIADLLAAAQKTDLTMKQLSAKAKSIEQKYDSVTLARQKFNNWRSSNEGKIWKQNQFEIIGRKCSLCEDLLPSAAHFHIDHILPLSKHPDKALELSNLQLLCSPCNLRKGAG